MQVARATGQRFMSVMREPYHETLWAFIALTERERIEALIDRVRREDGHFGTNAAVLDGKRLDERNRDLLADLRLQPRQRSMTKEEAQALAEEMIRRLNTKTFVPVTYAH